MTMKIAFAALAIGAGVAAAIQAAINAGLSKSTGASPAPIINIMGMPREPLTIQRVIGVALVAAVAVVLQSSHAS